MFTSAYETRSCFCGFDGLLRSSFDLISGSHGKTCRPRRRRSHLGQRTLLISAFIVAICITGAFIPSPCDESAHRSPTSGVQCDNQVMCGRYRLSRRKQLVEEYFDTASDEPEWTPRYNIAPTQPVPVIRQNPKEPRRELSLMRWGLIPSWAKDSSGAVMMINARSETAATKPAFRDPLTSRRCLVPADGFYEWLRSS